MKTITLALLLISASCSAADRDWGLSAEPAIERMYRDEDRRRYRDADYQAERRHVETMVQQQRIADEQRRQLELIEQTRRRPSCARNLQTGICLS